MKLSGQHVVAVGGSSGMGFAAAQAAAAEGAKVTIGSRDASNVAAARERLGGTAEGWEIDVGDEASVAGFFERVGSFDHLVFTAGEWEGHRQPRKIVDFDFADFTTMLDTRFTGALYTIKHAVPRMTQNGSISLTDGQVAHRPRKGAPLMCAMAGAVEHLARGLAIDLAPIRVNAICPGMVHNETLWGADGDEKFKEMTGKFPISRIGRPDEIAEAFLYLMKGTYTTGQVLMVDGGRILT